MLNLFQHLPLSRPAENLSRYPSPSGEDRNSERSYEFVNFLVRVELNLCPNGMNPLQLFLNSLRSLRNSVLSTLGEGKFATFFRRFGTVEDAESSSA